MRMKAVKTAGVARTLLVLGGNVSESHRAALRKQGCEILPCETEDGRVALPELLEDMAAIGIHSVLVEGGARTARAFLDEGLVDELMLFTGGTAIGDAEELVASPVSNGHLAAFEKRETLALGEDRLTRYTRREG